MSAINEDDIDEPLLLKDDDEKNPNVYWEISVLAFPAILQQFCMILPACINIWCAGQMKDAIKMDTVGLGAGVVDAFGIALF